MKELKGIPTSDGIAVGNALLFLRTATQKQTAAIPASQVADELARYHDAVAEACSQLQALIARLSEETPAEAEIFSAQATLLDDEEIAEEIRSCISVEHLSAASAVQQVYERYAAMLAEMPGPYLSARSADLLDISHRLLSVLTASSSCALSELTAPVILVARELFPSDTATMRKENVLAIVTEVGGETSHCAILARSFGIPAILGIKDITSQVADGQLCAVDGKSGKFWIDPDAQTCAALDKQAQLFQSRRAIMQQAVSSPAVLKDGERIEIGLNAGSASLDPGIANCDFVGLFRTEFLYMNSESMPSEEAQYQIYRTLLQQAGGKPVTIRTLDIGGDKELSYFELPKEQNPFLGIRAMRLCLMHREILQPQLRAILRAAIDGPLQIMFPMIGTLEDLHACRAALDEAAASLAAQGVPFQRDIPVGVMIEIPSAALLADHFAKEVDFASIGTNDLTQYLHAADRTNPDAAQYYQSYSPALFRLLSWVIGVFRKAEKPLCICGELGGDPLAISVLAGLGMRRLSMSPSQITEAKFILRNTALEEAQQLADKVLKASTQEEIRALLTAEQQRLSECMS